MRNVQEQPPIPATFTIIRSNRPGDSHQAEAAGRTTMSAERSADFMAYPHLSSFILCELRDGIVPQTS